MLHGTPEQDYERVENASQLRNQMPDTTGLITQHSPGASPGARAGQGPGLSEDLARRRNRRLGAAIAVFGPGLVVMLADTDVGSIITAANSGVRFGYRMLSQQLLLIPVLYIIQELTVRLGIFTGRGHGELIREQYGRFWAWISAAGLGVATCGALLTEFAGVAGVGELYDIPRVISVGLAAVALLAVVLTGSYRRVERAAIAVGLFEFVFFIVAWARTRAWGTWRANPSIFPRATASSGS